MGVFWKEWGVRVGAAGVGRGGGGGGGRNRTLRWCHIFFASSLITLNEMNEIHTDR